MDNLTQILTEALVNANKNGSKTTELKKLLELKLRKQ